MDLAAVTQATFAPLMGEPFFVAGLEPPLVLDAVREHAGQGGERTPFSLEFVGPAEPLLAQQTLRLEHAELGVLELFVVPIARDSGGARYEAVFG